MIRTDGCVSVISPGSFNLGINIDPIYYLDTIKTTDRKMHFVLITNLFLPLFIVVSVQMIYGSWNVYHWVSKIVCYI